MGPSSEVIVEGAYLQGLHIGGEAGYAHEALVRHLEHSLEIAINCHQLSGEARVRRDGHAVLSRHGDHRVTVVLVNSAEICCLKMIQMFFG